MQRLYCYVDETGQDSASSIFVVVAVVTAQEQEPLRQALMDIGDVAGTGCRKWHKSKFSRRLRYDRSTVREPRLQFDRDDLGRDGNRDVHVRQCRRPGDLDLPGLCDV